MSALLNKVVFVLDASSSMSHLRSKVVDVTNKLLESLKKEDQEMSYLPGMIPENIMALNKYGRAITQQMVKD